MASEREDLEPTPASFSTQADADDCYTVTVRGEVDVATSPSLRAELHSLVERGASKITLDLSSTTFIDSSGLGVLVGALKRLRETPDGGEVELRGMQDQVKKVFEITGLTNLFKVS
jgi:anti-sigma B factor antagonist